MFEKYEKVGDEKQGMNRRIENLLDLYCSEGEREPVFATPAGGWKRAGKGWRREKGRGEKEKKQTRRKRKKMDLSGRREKKKASGSDHREGRRGGADGHKWGRKHQGCPA